MPGRRVGCADYVRVHPTERRPRITLTLRWARIEMEFVFVHMNEICGGTRMFVCAAYGPKVSQLAAV